MNRARQQILFPLLRLAIFGNGFIALCAVVMCHTTARLFSLRLPDAFLPFIFLATLASYSLHWYLTDSSHSLGERSVWNQQHKGLLLGIFFIGGLMALALLPKLERYTGYLLPIVVLTFLYTAPKIDAFPFRYLRRVAVLKTTYLALVWTFTTTALPLLMESSGWQPAMTAWVANRFLLIFSICLWFDYRDRAEDRQSNWLTIVSRLTQKQVFLLAYFIAGSFGLTLGLLYQQGFSLGHLICLGVPMLLLLLVTPYSSRWKSDYWYYVFLDGLLMLAGVLISFFG